MAYTPTCAADCSDETLIAVGETDCISSANIELAEINELYLDIKSATAGQATNRIATYTAFGDNAAALTTWKGLHDNTTASKIRTLYGRGEKPEPTETTLTFRKAKTVNIGTKHTMVYTIDVLDKVTYQFLLKLQGCKSQFHMWYSTDNLIFGGQDGVIVDIEKVVFPLTGGRGENRKAILTVSWSHVCDPEYDEKTW